MQVVTPQDIIRQELEGVALQEIKALAAKRAAEDVLQALSGAKQTLQYLLLKFAQEEAKRQQGEVKTVAVDDNQAA